MSDLPALFLILATLAGGGTVLASPSVDPTPGSMGRGVTSTSAGAGSTMVTRPGKKLALVLTRQADGMFYADGEIGGQHVKFLIDTGSNVVILSPYDAARLGIGPGTQSASIDTAGGRTAGSLTYLPTLKIGGHELRDVDAAVSSTMLPVSLLGGNALSQMGEMHIKGATLTFG